MFFNTSRRRKPLSHIKTNHAVMSTSAKKLTQCFFYPKISAKFAPLNCICTYFAPMEVWQIVHEKCIDGSKSFDFAPF